jgi:O-antigen/teichoic acid export membrane protein
MLFSHRYLVTLLSSTLRAALNFAVSIQVAGYLMPQLYGSYQYILTICTAVLLFINMSTENAFFTFISKKKQHVNFYISYFLWQLIQISFVLAFFFLLHKDLYALFFKDFSIGLVSIALGASFFIGNIQNTLNHITESIRKTYVSQLLSIFIAVIHFIAILTLINFDSLTLSLLFSILFLEYLLYSVIIIAVLKKYSSMIFNQDDFVLEDMVNKFYIYCKPLFILGIFSFLYIFVDRWLIQTYVGSEGQAFFSISVQFATFTMLITSSVLKIFWKEITESIEMKDHNKTSRYFIVVSKHIFIISCLISTILFFFSDQILSYFYPDSYSGASLVFKLMMLYPILQSMGQLYSVFLFGAEQTKLYKDISICVAILSILLAILLLSDFGLNFGVEGIAIKLLVVNVLNLLILEYFIARFLNIKTYYLSKLGYFMLSFCGAFIFYKLQFFLNLHFLLEMIFVIVLYIMPFGLYLFNSMKKQLNIF